MRRWELNFELEKETPGAARYVELSPEGKRLTQRESVVGTIYMRKSALGNGDLPRTLKLIVEVDEIAA